MISKFQNLFTYIKNVQVIHKFCELKKNRSQSKKLISDSIEESLANSVQTLYLLQTVYFLATLKRVNSLNFLF